MEHHVHDDNNFALGLGKIGGHTYDPKRNLAKEYGIKKEGSYADPLLQLIIDASPKKAEELKRTIAQYLFDMTPKDMHLWMKSHQESSNTYSELDVSQLGAIVEKVERKEKQLRKESLEEARRVAMAHMIYFYIDKINFLMKKKYRESRKSMLGLPSPSYTHPHYLGEESDEDAMSDSKIGQQMEEGKIKVDIPRVYSATTEQIDALIEFYGEKIAESQEIPLEELKGLDRYAKQDIIMQFVLEEALRKIDTKYVPDVDAGAGFPDESIEATVGGTARMAKSLAYGAARNVVKKRPPAPPPNKWDNVLDRTELSWNGRERTPAASIMPGSETNFMIIIHGINANKKAEVWRDQAIGMFGAAHHNFNKAFIPLVDQNDTLDNVAPGVWEKFRKSNVGTKVFDYNAELTNSDSRRRRWSQVSRTKPVLFIIGVSNGGRIATWLEMQMRRDNALSNFEIRVLTVASPLAGTGMTSFLPDKLAYKMFSKNYVDEIKAKNQTVTLAMAARRGVQASPEPRIAYSTVKAQGRVRYWHITLEEDYLVSKGSGSYNDRLVDPGPDHVLKLSGVSHERAQEHPATLKFITKVADADGASFEQ